MAVTPRGLYSFESFSPFTILSKQFQVLGFCGENALVGFLMRKQTNKQKPNPKHQVAGILQDRYAITKKLPQGTHHCYYCYWKEYNFLEGIFQFCVQIQTLSVPEPHA